MNLYATAIAIKGELVGALISGFVIDESKEGAEAQSLEVVRKMYTVEFEARCTATLIPDSAIAKYMESKYGLAKDAAENK